MAITLKKKSETPEIRSYKFGPTTEGSASMKDVLGGKGANLAEMASLGLPVPPGFTIPCEASVKYKKVCKLPTSLAAFNKHLWSLVDDGLLYLNKCYGYMPLLSVRSGARVSMPGMMDTILNVGLTSSTLEYWEGRLGERAARDSYRRLIQMYSSVALEIPLDEFEHELHKMKEEVGVASDAELNEDHLSRLITRYRKVVSKHGKEFPDTLEGQLRGAITAVFKSWDNHRAIEYRKIHGYPDDWGTAVNIQSMVFGNMDSESCTGVLFSRDPSTGANAITGEFLVNAQGEDVVAGIRTPEPLNLLADWNSEVAAQLFDMVTKLEGHYRDMQDIEFTVQSGSLYLLQTRNGKRSPKAAFQIAHDLVLSGLITKGEAVKRVTQAQLMSLMQDTIDPKFKVEPNVVGIAAGGGLVSGVAVFSSEDAVNCTEPCILIRKETDPDDIAGMNASVGILTSTGGLTSHAAVVARGMNKTCVVGATDMTVTSNMAQAGAWVIHPGSKVTLDGATGKVWIGIDVPVIAGGKSEVVSTVLGWAVSLLGAVSERLELDYLTPMDSLESSIQGSTSSSLYVDTALIEGAERLSADEVTKWMIRLGNVLTKFNGSEIVVDLCGLDSYFGPEDMMFDRMFGLHDFSPLIGAKAAAMMDWPEDVKAKVIAKLPDDSAGASALLVNSGIKVTGKISTVEDLLNASGPVEVEPKVIKSVFGSKKAFETLRKLVEKTYGKKLSGTSASPVYWYDYLNEGAK